MNCFRTFEDSFLNLLGLSGFSDASFIMFTVTSGLVANLKVGRKELLKAHRAHVFPSSAECVLSVLGFRVASVQTKISNDAFL